MVAQNFEDKILTLQQKLGIVLRDDTLSVPMNWLVQHQLGMVQRDGKLSALQL